MTAKRVITWALALCLSVLTLNVSFSLISSASDLNVGLGIALLIGLLACWTPAMERGRKWVAKSISLGVALLVAIGTVSMGCTRVDPGYAGIKIDYYGSNKGVQDIPIVTGVVWYNPISTSILQYPTFVQTAIWTKSPEEGSPKNEEVSFNSKEGLTITGDISLSYQVDPTSVPAFYVKFRSDDLNLFTHGYLHNIARDAFNEVAARYTVEEIYGQKKEELLTEVRNRVNSQVKDVGVSIQQFGFIGAPRLPETVVDSLNGKIKATQDAMRVQNQLVQTQAEAQKVVAKAQGEAEANRILTSSITPTLLEWKRLENTSRAIEKWDGRRPMVEGMGSGGMLLNLNPSERQ